MLKPALDIVDLLCQRVNHLGRQWRDLRRLSIEKPLDELQRVLNPFGSSFEGHPASLLGARQMLRSAARSRMAVRAVCCELVSGVGSRIPCLTGNLQGILLIQARFDPV